jgi:hypothetical protein
MTFGEHVFLYCERGTNEAFLAEPINVISNIAFFIAALVGLQLVLWRPREQQSPDHFLLVGLVFLIGFGSVAFHLYADKGTELADVVPIGVFMLVYLGFALNRFLVVPPGWTVLLVIGFAAIVAISTQVRCWEGAIGFPGLNITGTKPCLNGSVGYLPALGALIIIGMLLGERHHRAAPYVTWAAVIFAISITLRSLDMALCNKIVIDGRNVGTHFIWHLLNALALFLLLRASLEGGPVAVPQVEAEPEEEDALMAPAAAAPIEAKSAEAEPEEVPNSSRAEGPSAKDEAPDEEPEMEDEPSEEPEPEGEVAAREPERLDEAPKAEPETKEGKKPKGKSRRKPSFPA